MGSSRLPNKVLMDINGKPNLWHLYHRLSHAKKVDKVIVATSDDPNCDPVESFCHEHGIGCYRGSEDDLLDRLYQAAKAYGADSVVRVTGDCPLVDPQVTDKVISCYESGDFDYVSNNQMQTFPHGLDVEIFSFKALEKAWETVKDPEMRALGPFCLYHKHSTNKIGNVTYPKKLLHIRITLDYEEDLQLIREIFGRLSKKKDVFLLDDILQLLKEHPGLNAINDKWKSHHRLKDAEKFL